MAFIRRGNTSDNYSSFVGMTFLDSQEFHFFFLILKNFIFPPYFFINEVVLMVESGFNLSLLSLFGPEIYLL